MWEDDDIDLWLTNDQYIKHARKEHICDCGGIIRKGMSYIRTRIMKKYVNGEVKFTTFKTCWCCQMELKTFDCNAFSLYVAATMARSIIFGDRYYFPVYIEPPEDNLERYYGGDLNPNKFTFYFSEGAEYTFKDRFYNEYLPIYPGEMKWKRMEGVI